MVSADQILEAGAKMFREKNTKYKSNYLVVGQIMKLLYPEGIFLKTEEDHIIYHEMSWTVGKLTRFAATDMKDEDSIEDMMVYCAIVAMLIKNRKENGK